jgi:hypothetical protein
MTVQALSSKDSCWSPLRRFSLGFVLAGMCVTANAEDDPERTADPACWRAEVLAHVREQIRLYGPLSRKREYFGFIYWDGQAVKSSVVRGSGCDPSLTCSVHVRGAAEGLPRGAKVLGEWHTHPGGDSSNGLSAGDVRGAWNNRKVRCYTAFYAASNGKIYSWDPASTSVVVAMRSRVLLGNYREPANDPAIIAAHQVPGSKCLSTNTNVQTADTATKSCKESATSR